MFNNKIINSNNDYLSGIVELKKSNLFIEDGKLISGSKSFLIIWEKIPKYKFLKRIFENPIIFPIFNIFYDIVAYFLYLKSKLKR